MAGEDPPLTARLRRTPCCSCNGACGDVHHPTQFRWKNPGQKGRRAHDCFALPMCHGCHMALHALSGPFKGWSGDYLRSWERSQLERLTGDEF